MSAEVSGRKRYATEFTPRFSDFDIQGILGAKQYLDFLSEARIDQMLRCYKVPLDHFAKRNQTFVFSSLQIDYMNPVYLGMQIVVETECTNIQGAVATVDFLFRNSKGNKEFAKGKATYHLVDNLSKRPVDISPEDVGVFLSVASL